MRIDQKYKLKPVKNLKKKKTKNPRDYLFKKIKVWSGRITIPNHIDYFEIHICKTEKNMVDFVNKWFFEQYNRDDFDKELFSGMFIEPRECTKAPFENERLCGSIFLNLEDLTHGIIGHEVWHATTFYERYIAGYSGNYLDDYSAGYCPEERGAYITESLLDSVYDFCEKNNLTVSNTKRASIKDLLKSKKDTVKGK